MKTRKIIQTALFMSVLGIWGCEDPVTIYVCTPGHVYCVDEKTLASCSMDGQITQTKCESGLVCSKENNVFGCYAHTCDPVTYTPECNDTKTAIKYCVNHKVEEQACSENFRCANKGEENNPYLSAACIAQGETMDVCTQGEPRCSPETGVRQICNKGEWIDFACPSHQQCTNGSCEDIPECNEGNKLCQTNDDGTESHMVCRDKKWIKTDCTENQTCSRMIGCITDSGLPSEGDPCTEGAETFCVEGYFYECINNQYAVVACNESNGRICLDRQAGDMCVIDPNTMSCSNNQGQSVSCCSGGINTTIFGQTCTHNQFSYWKCIDVDGTLYAQEHYASSLCRNPNTRAYCIEGISLVQNESCPIGCADDDAASATCHGNNVGDQCTAESFASRCLNTSTVRYCDEANGTIVEQTCAEDEICRQTECTSEPIPNEGDTCMAGSPGYCIDSDYLECINGVYVRSNCSAAIGKGCFTFPTGDKCLEDISSMNCTSRETGEPVPCCASDTDTIVNLSCSSGKIDFWDCHMVNGKGYAEHFELDSLCLNQTSMAYCSGTTPLTTECTTGCVQSDTTATCNGNTANTCNPATYKSTCINAKTQTICNAEGKVVEASCGEGEMCLTNKCEVSSLPAVGTACTPGSMSYCLNNSTILECIDGTYQATMCPAEAQLCKTMSTGEAACVNDLSGMTCTDATGATMPCCSKAGDAMLGECIGNDLPVYQCVQIDGVFYARYYASSGVCRNSTTREYCQNNIPKSETCTTRCSATDFLSAVCY